MKKSLTSMLVFGALLSISSVQALERDDIKIPATPVVAHVSFDANSDDQGKEAKYYQKQNSNSLTRLKARGEQLINERISSLEANATAITNSKLTAEQKATLTTLLSTNITELKTLKTSISASSDATSTKSLIESIYTKFRVYGIVIPQVRLEKRIYDLQNHVAKLSDSFIQVEAKINEYKNKGKDVTDWQKGLEDAKLLVATDIGKLSILLTQAQSLKPSDYGTSSKATIDAINDGIKAVSKDFNSIQKVVNKPKTLKNVTITDPLTASSWVWVSATSNGSTTYARGDAFVLIFEKSKRMNSTTDCNRISGSYTSSSGSLSFGPLMMTRMFCNDSQEGVYVDFLGKVKTYAVSSSTLTLMYDTGSMIFKKK